MPKTDAKSKAEPKPKAAPKKAGAALAAPKKMSQTTLKPTKKRPKPDTEDEDSEADPSLHDDSLLSNTPPSAKRPKKASGSKKMGAKPLREVENEAIAEAIDASLMMDGVDQPKAKKGSKSTETYQKVGSIGFSSRRDIVTDQIVAHPARTHH